VKGAEDIEGCGLKWPCDCDRGTVGQVGFCVEICFRDWWSGLGCGKLDSEQIVVVRSEESCCYAVR
jgi:hypothetical protein